MKIQCEVEHRNDVTLDIMVQIRQTAHFNGKYGAPDELLGHPVHADTNMDAIATGKKTIVFGNFERGYFARIAGGVRVESTNADKWTTDLISVRFIVRGGGHIVDTNALRHLVQA